MKIFVRDIDGNIVTHVGSEFSTGAVSEQYMIYALK